MAWFDYFTTPAPTGSIPSWLAAPLGLLPYTPPSTTVPIPPNTMAQPRPNFMGPGRDQFNSVRGVTEAVTGSPFAPTPFDESPNVFRPGAAPGQIDVATKPPLPDAPRNPAPMMARNPAPAATSMMDVDTLPLVNSVPYAQKAATPAAPQTSTRKPFDWGPDATLWPMLMQAGAAMMQPSWYGLGGQITQGLGAASEAAQKAPMQRAQRRLLEAQVGEVESKAAARAGLRDFATRANLPKAVALALQLSPEKAADILEKYDPAMKAAYLQFVEEKSGATAKGSFPYDVAKAAAGATNISVKMATETQARHDLLQKYREAANRETDPQKRATLTAQADSLERQITIGEKQFPEHYLKAARNLSEATASAAEAVKLLSDPNVSRFNFDDRAKIRQQVEAVRLAYADLKNRGANFTEQEQKMIEALYRGDPLKWTDMPLRSRQSYIEGMRIAHAAMVREWNSIERAFMTGRPSITPLPVPNTGPTTPPPPPGFRPLR